MGWRDWLAVKGDQTTEDRSRSLENPNVALSDETAWVSPSLGGPSATGETVNGQTAITVPAVWECVRILAEDVASLPLHIYERTDNGKVKAPKHPLYQLLHTRPNPEISSMVFRETMQAHLALFGNAYAEVEVNAAGRPVALWPITPDRVTPRRVRAGEIVYDVEVDGREIALSNVLHIPGLSFDGMLGYSPITVAREAVGLALATQKFGARLFGNGARPGGVLEHPGRISTEAAKNLKRSWEDAHGGLSNAHRVAILEEGLKWSAISVPPEDAQFLETRQFQVRDIARIFRIPPHMLGDMEGGASYSSIEQQALAYLKHTLRPWLVRWEQAINWTLFTEGERGRYFAEHSVDGLLRGDISSRYSAYNIGRNGGWLSVNDIRELENMNPLEEKAGGTYLVPLNMTALDANGTVMMEPPDAKTPTPDRSNAYSRLIQDVAERMVSRETFSARKAWKKGAPGFGEWLGEFYASHIEQFAKALGPVLATIGELEGDTRDSAGLALGIATAEAGIAQSELRAALQSGRDIDEVLDEWEASRAGEITRRAGIQPLLKRAA